VGENSVTQNYDRKYRNEAQITATENINIEWLTPQRQITYTDVMQ
jgi:hypothetical protein